MKEHLEGFMNFLIGIFAMCCGHITLLQCSTVAGYIANIGGAALVVIQFYRTFRKKG